MEALNHWLPCFVVEEQNENRCREKRPVDLLEKAFAEALNRWLLCFVVEIRREDGKPYPPSTLCYLLAGLYQYSRNCN